MRLNFGREGFIFFSFYRFQKIYPDNTIIEFPVILNQHKRKQKKRFPVKLIRFGKPRDFLDYPKILHLEIRRREKMFFYCLKTEKEKS